MTTIQYELTADDFVEFNHFHHNHSPELRRRLLVSRIGIPLFMILALLLTPLLTQRNDRGYLDELTQMRLFFVVPPALFFLRTICVEATTSTIDTENVEGRVDTIDAREMLGKCSVTLSVDTVSIQRPSSLSTFGWDAIDGIRANSDYCYIYVTSVSAVILPRSAFHSKEAFDEYIREAKQHLSHRALTQSKA